MKSSGDQINDGSETKLRDLVRIRPDGVTALFFTHQQDDAGPIARAEEFGDMGLTHLFNRSPAVDFLTHQQ
jgi:hypothetical protein